MMIEKKIGVTRTRHMMHVTGERQSSENDARRLTPSKTCTLLQDPRSRSLKGYLVLERVAVGVYDNERGIEVGRSLCWE